MPKVDFKITILNHENHENNEKRQNQNK